MHRILFILFTGSISTSFAMSTINLDQQQFTCNKIRLTSKATSNMIKQNCKNVKIKISKQITGADSAKDVRGSNLINNNANNITADQLEKVSFYTDNNSYLQCYYRNNKLYECETESVNDNAQAK